LAPILAKLRRLKNEILQSSFNDLFMFLHIVLGCLF
jgi:hypothetical protein